MTRWCSRQRCRIADAENDGGCPGQCTGQRPALNTYLAKHYAPQDACHCWGGAAETLENSLGGLLPGPVGDRGSVATTQRTLNDRGTWWKNTFDPAVGYQRARKADGTWQPGFTPSTDVGFAQGSSATYTWMVPQDVSGLATRWGDTAVQRLDGFFHDAAGQLGGEGRQRTPLRPDERARSAHAVALQRARRRLEDAGDHSRRSSTPSTAPGRRGCRATTIWARCPPGTCSPRSACSRRRRAGPSCSSAARCSRRSSSRGATAYG